MFSKVLIGVDGQAGGRDAIALARRLAAPDAQLTLAHVHPGGERIPRGPYGADFSTGQHQASTELLEHERATAGLDAQLVTIASPWAGEGLHRLAEFNSADLLVVGATSHSRIGRVLLGDHTRAALNGATCAVAIAPAGYAETAGPLRTIGVAYNGTPESEAALAAAKQLAARDACALKAFSVVELPGLGDSAVATAAAMRAALVAAQRQLHALAGVTGDASYGPVGTTLAAFGACTDLLIVGSRSYGPVGRLIHGSTSNYLARRARCPLLVLPRDGDPTQHLEDVVDRGTTPEAIPR